MAALLWLALVTTNAAAQQRLVVEVGKGLRLGGTESAESVFIADPGIADVNASPGEAHFIYGKSPGETTVIAVGMAGETLFQYDVVVIHNMAEMRRALYQRFPGQPVSISSARGSIFVSGTVSDERTHQDLLTTLRNSVPDSILIDEVVVAQSKVIQLDVKLLEVARDQLEKHGIDWSALITAGSHPGRDAPGDGAGLSASLNLLLSSGAATIVTQSTLATTGNKRAEFSVGNEIAIPTFSGASDAGSGNFSIDFKFVGINMSFLPTVLPGGVVNLEIKSEVSDSQPTARTINGNSFPNLTSRRFSTTVDLRSGQSFAVAGLSRQETSEALRKPRNMPGQDPLRVLLGRDRINATQRDLVVVVTPRFGDFEEPDVAQVIEAPESNLEYILSQKTKRSGKNHSDRVRLFGPAGFLY